MAAFGVEATELSPAQGQGTNPIQAVEERVVNTAPLNIINELGDIFANGLKDHRKAKAEEHKNAVLGEYIRIETGLADALATGQLPAARVTATSKANFAKFLAANPQYVSELTQARQSLYGGTALSDAERHEKAAFDLRQKEKTDAAAAGYVFYDGMDKEVEDKNLDAYRVARRVDDEVRRAMARTQEARAQAGEARAAESHQVAMAQEAEKQTAAKGLVEVAALNFDVVGTNAKSLFEKVQTGAMSPEVALMTIKTDTARIRARMNAVAKLNPQLAAPWIAMFDDMEADIVQILDPKNKTANEVTELKARLDSRILRAQIAALETNPKLVDAVAATRLFPGEDMVSMAQTPIVKQWLLTGEDKKVEPVVGTPDDKKVFEALEKATKNIEKLKGPELEKASKEMVTLLNRALSEVGSAGTIRPDALKNATKFFSSAAFGRMVLEGKVDKETAATAARVYRMTYDPAVQKAITDRLQETTPTGQKLSDVIHVTSSGGKIAFNLKPSPKTTGMTPEDYMGVTYDSILTPPPVFHNAAQKKSLDEAAEGLNQLVRLHAHLEGTTDYAKYWEDNKHLFMRDVFPDPNKLKPGQVITATNGKKYKYLGGNFNDLESSYVEVRNEQQGK